MTPGLPGVPGGSLGLQQQDERRDLTFRGLSVRTSSEFSNIVTCALIAPIVRVLALPSVTARGGTCLIPPHLPHVPYPGHLWRVALITRFARNAADRCGLYASNALGWATTCALWNAGSANARRQWSSNMHDGGREPTTLSTGVNKQRVELRKEGEERRGLT